MIDYISPKEEKCLQIKARAQHQQELNYTLRHFDLQMESTHDPCPPPLLTTQVTNNLSNDVPFFFTPQGIDGRVCSRSVV
jgi:hypothetical protein